MIAYISKFCSFAVRVHIPEGMDGEPRPVEVVKVIPETDEYSWKRVGSFSHDNIDGAIDYADELEERET